MNWKTILLTKTLIHWVTMTTGNRLLIPSKFIKVYAFMYIKCSHIPHDKQSKWELMYNPEQRKAGEWVFLVESFTTHLWVIFVEIVCTEIQFLHCKPSFLTSPIIELFMTQSRFAH